ncbi:SAM-dependent methyltransferase [Ceratobasidium sp. AG-Ba]|nr:SAM-dependent methyltransferase [Ceratobasidium sp. AG-Ba]
MLLKPGGRFVGEFSGHMNCLGVRLALHEVMKKHGLDSRSLDPWYFPRAEEYAKVLESEGFEVQHTSLYPRIVTLPGSLIEFLRAFVRGSALASMGDKEAEVAMQEISDICELVMKDKNGAWAIMYVRLRFVAIKPE